MLVNRAAGKVGESQSVMGALLAETIGVGPVVPETVQERIYGEL